ncbi:hypothetical protein BJX62DRAFT_239290 [Aspergillus germanicus]
MDLAPDTERLRLSDDAPPPYSLSASTTPTTPNATPPEIKPVEQYCYREGIYGLNARATLRILQYIFAIIVTGLYGVDLGHATSIKAHARAEWLYAEFVAAASAITCLIHCLVTVTRVAWCAWDGVLFVLWLAQVGVFGTIFYPETKSGDENAIESVTRMRAAVWISLVNMFLWFVTSSLGVGWCIRTRSSVCRTDGDSRRFRRALGRVRNTDEENSCEPLQKGLITDEYALIGEKHPLDNKTNGDMKGTFDGASGDP